MPHFSGNTCIQYTVAYYCPRQYSRIVCISLGQIPNFCGQKIIRACYNRVHGAGRTENQWVSVGFVRCQRFVAEAMDYRSRKLTFQLI